MIETFTLYGVIYPLVIPMQNNVASRFPMLYILDEMTALLVPLDRPHPGDWDGRYDTLLPPMEEFLLPIEINLSTQTYRRWSEEEVNNFLQNDGRFELDLERYTPQWRGERVKEHGWSASEFGPLHIRQTRIPAHIQSVLTNESLLIFADGDDIPLFSVPSELTLRLYHQTEDGTRYFVFEL